MQKKFNKTLVVHSNPYCYSQKYTMVIDGISTEFESNYSLLKDNLINKIVENNIEAIYIKDTGIAEVVAEAIEKNNLKCKIILL